MSSVSFEHWIVEFPAFEETRFSDATRMSCSSATVVQLPQPRVLTHLLKRVITSRHHFRKNGQPHRVGSYSTNGKTFVRAYRTPLLTGSETNVCSPTELISPSSLLSSPAGPNAHFLLQRKSLERLSCPLPVSGPDTG
ncbi:tyrosine-protein kinase SgK223 [Lates japonicus]|uniref:Tyrosine-protein kinase SgK223 n=1 Tax=Lates japonicus TaxID=270547 RepID=A0AAD3MKY0_LATJO|nr:tyrosine-protein kinase SgK223 [Lates japonicus]